jgi:hypothetical protein
VLLCCCVVVLLCCCVVVLLCCCVVVLLCCCSEGAARARRVPKCQVWYFPNSGKEKSKIYHVPQNWKIIFWVGRILKFHAGAGVKQIQLLLPFPRTTKMNVLGHHYFAQKRCKTSQIKFKLKMAPTIAPKISPTLRTGVGSTAGARDGSPAVEGGPVAAKHQKTAEGKIS